MEINMKILILGYLLVSLGVVLTRYRQLLFSKKSIVTGRSGKTLHGIRRFLGLCFLFVFVFVAWPFI